MFFSFIILLWLSFFENILTESVTRYFISTEVLKTDMQEILKTYESGDFMVKEYKPTPSITDTNLNETIIKFKKAYSDQDMLFAYLPKANMTLLNIIAEEQNIYVWNAVNTAVEVCYSRIILGYYTTRSSLRCIYI